MRQSFFVTASWAVFAAAHGHVKEYIIDGTSYPSFDPKSDYDAKWSAKRVEWGFSKAKGGVGPVENVNGPDINCRFAPLQAPAITGEVRAGANITFQWADWFINHPGPVMTYMGLLPESGDVSQTEYFKIDQASYDPKTQEWGTDRLVKNDNRHTSTIPSDIKPGTYVVRHEIISLHNALNDDWVKKISGAQLYPQCIKVKVTGSGTATPKTIGKFPGAYKWDDEGILYNVYFHPNKYVAPGGPVYQSASFAPPAGPKPVPAETGWPAGDQGTEYRRIRTQSDKQWESAVHNDVASHPGKGGCIWEVDQTPKQAKCTQTNPKDPKYKGLGQPPESPMYVSENASNRKNIGRGPVVKYLFDPTQPRWEQRSKATGGKLNYVEENENFAVEWKA
ncbi:hypothetical protein EJ08DRAFT_701266 [Tothia fuscella]|uniref:lytic cellulose monooxygenase (C4-dehydrogenating) n=1 Tax=Tothia fuscella TaxID=1048955 RepID=A0A9P4NJE0_9PEZI|nr:hypothetical protein EJ08DRAFT_701266 [Tothia fuscella]